MKATPLFILRRLSILAILFLLSITALTAQIKIKTRVEIGGKPKALPMKPTSSNSDIPYFEIVKMPQAYDQETDIRVNIPSQCTITGSYTGENTCYDLSMDGYPLPKEAFNTSACTILGIGPVSGCPCGGFIDLTPAISVGTTSITVDVNATWCCLVPNYVQTNWRFTIIAEPVSLSLNMVVSPDYLDANDYGSHVTSIGAALYDGSGNPFEICRSYEPQPTLKFKIENPLIGMTLTGTASDGTSIEGTSIVVPPWAGAYHCYFVWDGSDIPNETDTVFIKAYAYNGTTAEQNILLKKVIPDHFTVTPDRNPIYAGESVIVRASAKDASDNEVVLDGGKNITFLDESGTGSFIVGSDTLSTQVTVSYDQAKNGSVKYDSKLDLSNLADDNYVRITVCRTEYPERNGWCLIDVMPPCPVVTLSKSKIPPGSTIAVTVMAQTVRGNFPYPSDQKFIASMDADARYGKLHCPGASGTNITGTQPFKFIAANSIDVDSVVVNITVSPVSHGGGGAAASMKDGQKDTLQRQAKLMSEKQTKTFGKKAVLNIDGTKNVLVSQQASFLKKLAEQKNLIAQKGAKRQALMDAITEAIKTQKTGKSDAPSAKKLNAMVQDLAEGSTCTESAEVTIEGPVLVVTPPADKNHYLAGTDLPKMPNPVVTAHLENFKNDENSEVDFKWELTIKWRAKGINFSTPQDITEKYKGTAMGQNSDIVDLEIGQTLYGETDMRGGDDITLTVTCTTKVDGKVYTKVTKNPFVIKGKNPDVPTLLAELNGDQFSAVAWKESKFNQFAKNAKYATANPNSLTPDYPLFNTSCDFGIMQIHDPRQYPTWLYKEGWDEYDSYFCDDIIWNWVANVQQGKLKLNHIFNLAKLFNENFENAPQLNNDQQWKYTYCSYHAGESYYYWKWEKGDPGNGISGKWKEGPADGKDGGRTYANDAWDIYNKKPWPKK